MAFRCIGQDCAIQISDGGVQDGVPTYGSATVLKSLARRVMIDDTLVTEDVSSLGDTRVKKRGKRGESRIEIELFIADAGAYTATIGNYTKVEFKTLSSLDAYSTFTGILTGNRIEAPDGAQIQTLTIECDADQ